MMNLKFKPWILAGIIRHNHSLTDFQATERLIAVWLRSMQNVTDGIWHEKGWFWKGEGGFWLVFIVTWLYCPINNKGAKIKFIWKSVGIHLFVNIRASGLYFFFLSCVYFIEDSLFGICHLWMCWHWLVTMNDPKIVVIKRNGTDGPQFPLRTNECLFGRWEKLVRRKANYFELMKSIIAVL